jgi:hypothetical protein
MTALRDAIDGGAGPGVFRFYTGSRPATGGTATTLLAEVTCSDPCGAVASGVLTFSAFTQDASANATGTAVWCRVTDSAGTFVGDFSVTATGGGGEITLSTTSIVTGQPVQITSLTITEGNP